MHRFSLQPANHLNQIFIKWLDLYSLGHATLEIHVVTYLNRHDIPDTRFDRIPFYILSGRCMI